MVGRGGSKKERRLKGPDSWPEGARIDASPGGQRGADPPAAEDATEAQTSSRSWKTQKKGSKTGVEEEARGCKENLGSATDNTHGKQPQDACTMGCLVDQTNIDKNRFFGVNRLAAAAATDRSTHVKNHQAIIQTGARTTRRKLEPNEEDRENG